MKITTEMWGKIITAIASCIITIIGVLSMQSCVMTMAISKPNGNGNQSVGTEQTVSVDSVKTNLNLRGE